MTRVHIVRVIGSRSRRAAIIPAGAAVSCGSASASAMARSLLGDDGVLQQTHAVDFDLDRIARLHPQRRRPHPAYATWRARHDDITWRERRETGDVFDQLRGGMDHH